MNTYLYAVFTYTKSQNHLGWKGLLKAESENQLSQKGPWRSFSSNPSAMGMGTFH